MGKLFITVATTVDGVIDGFEWFVPQGEHDQAGLDQFKGAAAMLLGRKSYEGFAGFWPTQEGPWADMLNPPAEDRRVPNAVRAARVERAAASE
jgi:dihydrofolate reductase